jgi:phosphonate transport system substrate-binding protein
MIHLTMGAPEEVLMRVIVMAILLVLGFAGPGGAADPSWPKTMTFTIMATENPAEVTRRWGPILAQLEADLGVQVLPVVADFRGIVGVWQSGTAELGHLMPKAYVEVSANKVHVEPVAQFQLPNGSLGYRSCLIAHADSDIFTPEDMAGRTFAFTDRGSTSGYLVPAVFFMTEMGIDPNKHFSKIVFSGSHEASIRAVAAKQVEVASTNLVDLQQAMLKDKALRASLRVIWVSRLIPNDPIVVRKDLPASLRQAVQTSLLTMRARKPEAFKELGTVLGGFAKVDDAKYEVVREMVEAAKKLPPPK